MDIIEEEVKTKRCPKCGRILPLSEFYNDKNRKDGRRGYCKQCQKAVRKEEYQTNRDTILKKQAEYRANNKEKIAEYQSERYVKKRDVILKQHAEYYQENKEAIAQKHAEYYQANKEAIAQKHAEYYQANKDTILQKAAEYYQENKEAIAQKHAAYKAAHKEAISKRMVAYNFKHKDERKAYNAEHRDPILNPLGWAKMIVAKYRQMDRERGFDDSKTITAEWFLENIMYKPCAHCGLLQVGAIGANRLNNNIGHEASNLEPCCRNCNSRLGAIDQIERGLAWFQKGKKQSFKEFVNEHKAKDKNLT